MKQTETKLSPGALDHKPANMTFREFYMRLYTRPGWEDQYQQMEDGFGTYELIQILRDSATPAGKASLVTEFRRLTNLPLDDNIMNFKRYFNLSKVGYGPKTIEGEALVKIRPQIYDMVARLIVELGLDRPGGQVNPLNTNIQALSERQMTHILISVGFSIGRRSVTPEDNGLVEEMRRRAFMKAWALTSRDQEPRWLMPE